MSTPETEEEPRELLILYATETGNAQDAADYIARQCRRIDFDCHVASIEQCSFTDLLAQELVLFVISTTGSGVEPRSMTTFWNNLLRSDLPPNAFEDLYYSVFGLGDSAYEKFCWAAKKLSRRMESLGGVQIQERGEGDEQHPLGIDGALKPWTDEVIEALLEMFPLPRDIEMIPVSDIPPARVQLNPASQETFEKAQEPLKTDLTYHTATVKANTRMTASDWNQDVRRFEFSFEEDISYSPGDVAVIHPSMSTKDIDGFLATMEWDEEADEPFEIEQIMFDQTLSDHLPHTTTLRELFTRFLDFNAVPRRTFFQYLRYFTDDDLEKEKLDEFLSPEGADELYEYCYRVRRTIWEVLTEFRHVAIPRDYIFDVFPPLRPREFSIASSIKKHPREIHLCVAIVKYRTKLKIPRKGVCTTFLSTLNPGDTLQIGLKKGMIELPPKAKTPVICVGPGTGIAPMRAVIEERIESGALSNTLYFGCRSTSKDHHFGEEWKKYAEEKGLVYRAAFSRDGKEGEKRVYVQDLIREDAERIWKLVGEQEGWVFISGSSNKMPAAVKESIVFAVQKYGEYSEELAKQYVHDMVREGRLIEECWS
ncbi:unnamed protein product [Cyclocybe aegerita]|uniref:NADPH-dependent diflavin oxidoreductase 1 n=1 Tax=Cyclocybe aegerita TaxID=1973307 RepID=A0A8S0W4Y6_CYCAE|nr:unnamed protein product [Cyclocybe aegerita]